MPVRDGTYQPTNPLGCCRRSVSALSSYYNRPWLFLAIGMVIVACSTIKQGPESQPTTHTAVAISTSASPTITHVPSIVLSPPGPTNSTQSLLGSDYTLVSIADGLIKPVYLTHSGDDSGRLFIVEQGGRVLILLDDRIIATPFLDIRSKVSTHTMEQGLLGLAFHPDYATNGLFYVHYTDQEGDTVVSSWKVSQDHNIADHGSEMIVLTHPQPYGNHNGGHIAFGPDGYLYIGLGDGGSRGDPDNNGQDPLTLLGAILRIDVDLVAPYGLPTDNPFLSFQNARPEVWLYGLRNPWRFSFDRLTGDLYIGDVGQDDWEEINFLSADDPAGVNYGWNRMEGHHCYRVACEMETYTAPISEYHQSYGGCSVTGGYVYRGIYDNGLRGVYLYGDYCSGVIHALWLVSPGEWRLEPIMHSGLSISSFGEDKSGELYVVDHRGGVYWLKHVNIP